MADEWVPEFAEDPRAYGKSTSLNDRGYRPLAGFKPDFAKQADGAVAGMPCPKCPMGWDGIYMKECEGGTFTCWVNTRRTRVHTDYRCGSCGHSWASNIVY